jgi:hypothetical protein
LKKEACKYLYEDRKRREIIEEEINKGHYVY